MYQQRVEGPNDLLQAVAGEVIVEHDLLLIHVFDTCNSNGLFAAQTNQNSGDLVFSRRISLMAFSELVPRGPDLYPIFTPCWLQ